MRLSGRKMTTVADKYESVVMQLIFNVVWPFISTE